MLAGGRPASFICELSTACILGRSDRDIRAQIDAGWHALRLLASLSLADARTRKATAAWAMDTYIIALPLCPSNSTAWVDSRLPLHPRPSIQIQGGFQARSGAIDRWVSGRRARGPDLSQKGERTTSPLATTIIGVVAA